MRFGIPRSTATGLDEQAHARLGPGDKRLFRARGSRAAFRDHVIADGRHLLAGKQPLEQPSEPRSKSSGCQETTSRRDPHSWSAAGRPKSGAVTIDSGFGRRVRELGPVTWEIAADRETVFDVIASPYLAKTPRSMKDHLDVWEPGTDMVLAAHYTKVKCGVTSTVETVHFERPDRINFRLVRGPVPHVRESFVLEAAESGSILTWTGELGTDFGAFGALWGDVVARSWENAVRSSMKSITSEAERRFRPGA